MLAERKIESVERARRAHDERAGRYIAPPRPAVPAAPKPHTPAVMEKVSPPRKPLGQRGYSWQSHENEA
mgnify:CR=1 FL=1